MDYDLFVSYAHLDDHDGWVVALIEAIRAEHAKFTPNPLAIFFDRSDIRTMDDWEHRIFRGLRGSKAMLAVLSPKYLESLYCRKEWERYLDHELDRAMTGEAIAPIYTIAVPGFEHQADSWLDNIRRRQHVDVREWWRVGTGRFEERRSQCAGSPCSTNSLPRRSTRPSSRFHLVDDGAAA